MHDHKTFLIIFHFEKEVSADKTIIGAVKSILQAVITSGYISDKLF